MSVGLSDEDFGRWVQGRRRSLELSLRQVSERTNLSNPELAQIERGLMPASDEIRARLIDLLREDGGAP